MSLSKKQIDILRFPYQNYEAIICDGAVRAGKTAILSISFILWAMAQFDNHSFAICGHTVGSAERNIITPLLCVKYLQQNFRMEYRRGEHMLKISRGKQVNRFYLFGGRDESSYTLIQGLTLAGAFLDEVALMPRSFVEQTLARCSVENARFWFSCNPEGPNHWFYREWILQAQKHKAKYLHFTMRDNPSLSPQVIARYERMYEGMFYQRYIQGKWVMAQGVIYDMFDEQKNTYTQAPEGLGYLATRMVAVDYGTKNPCVFLDIYDDGDIIYVAREYRWDAAEQGRQKTDQEYLADMQAFLQHGLQGAPTDCAVICDPSAASLITAFQNQGIYVMRGKNQVLEGIQRVGSLLGRGKIKIHTSCTGLLSELGEYVWEENDMGKEQPVKEHDHSADALRYFCMTALANWRVTGE